MLLQQAHEPHGEETQRLEIAILAGCIGAITIRCLRLFPAFVVKRTSYHDRCKLKILSLDPTVSSLAVDNSVAAKVTPALGLHRRLSSSKYKCVYCLGEQQARPPPNIFDDLTLRSYRTSSRQLCF